MSSERPKVAILDLGAFGARGFIPPGDLRTKGVLGKALAVGGLDRDQFLPLDRSNSPSDCIIALGEKAFRSLVFVPDKFGMDKQRGYVHWSPHWKCKVICSYHPGWMREGKMNLMQALIYDLQLAWKKPLPSNPANDERLIIYPSTEDLEAFVSTAVADAEYGICDIETPYSQGKPEDDELLDDPSSTIIRVSIGYIDRDEHVRAITFPFTPPYLPALKRFLSSDLPIIFWNADYDVPRLELNECPITGKLLDAMWLFHFLYPDLPRSLAAASSMFTILGEWKSLSTSEQELYSGLDSLATGLTFLGICSALKKFNQWETAWSHVVELQQVLRRMRQKGLLIDLKALKEFTEYLTAQMTTSISALNLQVPPEARPTHTVKAKHQRGRCVCATPALKGLPSKTKLLTDSACVNCAGTGWNPPVVTLLDFNPSSSEQVKALIRALGHKVPVVKDNDGEDKETTDKKFIDDLAAQYPDAPYKIIREYRQFAILRNTFASWPLHRPKDPRLADLKHPDGSFTYAEATTKLALNTSTGRLASQNPNMQNIPKEGELADQFKRCIVATPGHTLFKRDYSSIEAVLTGYFSNDPDYMRLALKGVHTYRCAQYFGRAPSLELPDEELGRQLKALKGEFDVLQVGERSSIYQRFKKINHTRNYKGGAKTIFRNSPGTFKDLTEVKKLLKFFDAQSPKRKIWWDQIEARCRKEYYIENPYHYRRYFWNLPSDLPRATAQDPQSTAAAIIKESMLLIAETDNGEFMRLQVHDELIFDAPTAPGSCLCHPLNQKTWQERDEEVRVIMERPLIKLNGLAILSEGTFGDTYASHESTPKYLPPQAA